MRQLAACLLGLMLASAGWAVEDATTLRVPAGETEIPVARYSAAGSRVLLWLPSEYGVLPQEHRAARALAQQGIETWLADLYGARFLPAVASSAETLPAEDVYHLIRAAFAAKREVWLSSAGRGAKYALEGARLWQEREGQGKPLAGAILLYPNLYLAQPEPGSEPAYLPVTAQTRLNVYILQGELSPWYWTLDTLTSVMRSSGSQIVVRTVAGIRDRFYFRDDAMPAERELGEHLPTFMRDLILHPPAESPK
ncbi:hypothetical protein [Thiobacter aerophilum]|uniref:Alpha/beta hydrolase n=1 Tax=Thiobacter aerophilum TaxID=3121275 RepID=A0ABV0EFT0_9BURK